MRTFEFRDAKSSKFWNIDLQGKQFTVAYGKIGAKGQTQTKTFADDAKALKEYDKLVAEKLGKGYVETTPGAAPAATADREALEKGLCANPDDRAAHAAYADWLTEHGDPRGELISVQLALEEEGRGPAERKELQAREKHLLDAHQREWLGDLAPYLLDQQDVEEWRRDSGSVYKFSWARGWVGSLEVPELGARFARLLWRAPAARLLRRLTIHGTSYADEDPDAEGDDVPEGTEHPALYPLRNAPFLPQLRVLQLGELFDISGSGPSCHTSGEGVVDLVAGATGLEELYLMAHDIDTAKLFRMKQLTRLRALRVDHIHRYPLELLAANPSFSNLTYLSCWPHGLEHGDEPYIRLPQLRAILRSSHLTNLSYLALHATDVGNPGCEEIVKSGALRRLKTLSLVYGCITDEGAEMLAASPDIRHLEYLDLAFNGLTNRGIAALQRTGIKVRTDQQMNEASLEQREYLWYGDPE